MYYQNLRIFNMNTKSMKNTLPQVKQHQSPLPHTGCRKQVKERVVFRYRPIVGVNLGLKNVQCAFRILKFVVVYRISYNFFNVLYSLLST